MTKKKVKSPEIREANIEKEKIITISFGEIHPNQPGLCLNIGSGDQKIQGYINVDKYNPGADAQWDAGHLQLNDCSVALIKSYQTIEHFGHEEFLPILKEWFRVLKPQGELHINTPDIIDSCALVAKDPSRQWLLARIFGNQSHDGQFHKWGYTVAELSNLVGMAGFANVIVANYNEADGSLWIYVKAVR
jgi:predicted SAM-dependent methyltransferase